MAAVKTARTLRSSTSVSAGASDTSGVHDCSTTYGSVVTVKITNGATGPTLPCVARFEVSHDNSAWKTMYATQASTAANAVHEYSQMLPAPVMFARVVCGGHTDQAVTVESFAHELTTI